jgi:hypothetical protein
MVGDIIMTSQLDSIMLGWLAREARFKVYVYFAPNTPIGYQVNRMVILTKRPEPLFYEWMQRTHGISARNVQKNDDIHKVIDILLPIKELVYDIDNMDKMSFVLKEYPRRWKHDDVLRLIHYLDDE